MFKIENSPEYEAKMAKVHAKCKRENQKAKREYGKARTAWRAAGSTWMQMNVCPFAALDNAYGIEGTIEVTDGKSLALVTVKHRFGTPVFWKKEPETIMRDGMFCLVGGEEDPRPDLPAWWWKWECTDLHGSMTYAGGEETGRKEIGFVPTHWSFLREPPKNAKTRRRMTGAGSEERVFR